MSPKNLIIKYLDKARILNLATVSRDAPHCVSVYFAHDNAHNLYWISLPDSRHSQEIAKNHKVAGTIVLPQEYGDPTHGLQVHGTARQITDPAEIREFVQAYAERYNVYTLGEFIINETTPHRLYQLKPDSFTLFDAQSFPEQPRQTWQLPETAV